MDTQKTIKLLQSEIVRLKYIITQMQNAEKIRLKTRHEKQIENENRFKTLSRNIPLGLYRRTCGSKGKLVMVNPVLVKMFGYNSEQELNQVLVKTLYYNELECNHFSSKLFEHKEIIKEQLKMKRKDGSPIWVAVTATVICDSNGVPQYFDGIMEDITKAKEAQKEKILRQEQLLQADKMISLGLLVSGVAHEINNPNQFILSHVIPLKKTWIDAVPILDRYYVENGDFVIGGQKYSIRKKRIPSMFKNIEEGTSRINRIVNELRDYTKEQPADLTQQVNINQIIGSALSLLENLIRKSTNQFFVSYCKEAPLFLGDYQRIEQVIVNMLQNSCQSMQKTDGKISINSEYQKHSKCIVVSVSDTGCGISSQNIKRITDPFFTTKRTAGGTGLGLSISQTIVLEHGGRLEFESEEQKGTTVKMFLPAISKTSKEKTNEENSV